MSVVSLEMSENWINGFVENIKLFFNHECLVCWLLMSLTINKIHIGFSNEEGLAESHYGFFIKPFFVNRVLQTRNWNILKVCNFFHC